MAVKKGLRRLTWLQSSHLSETEIKPIFLINKNVIVAGTKEKKNKRTKILNGDGLRKKLVFRPNFFKIFNFLKIVIIII